MRILVWHLHGSYCTALFQGPHTYLVPTLPDRAAYGLGRSTGWDWPPSVVEVSPQEAANAEVDLVLLQRPEELELATIWLGGRRPGRDVPAIFLEHSTSRDGIKTMRHPMADRDDLLLVHVTHFNRLFWDNGSTLTRVVEHGILDAGYSYTGEIDRAVVAINEPVRRNRVTGSDLIPVMREQAGIGIDLFGWRSEAMGGVELRQDQLHAEMAKRRVYFHPLRWTSLGLTLLEAMYLGMPAVLVSTTEAAEVLRDSACEGGVIMSNDLDVLAAGLRRLVNDPDEARERGKLCRKAVAERFNLERFLTDWDTLFTEAIA